MLQGVSIFIMCCHLLVHAIEVRVVETALGQLKPFSRAGMMNHLHVEYVDAAPTTTKHIKVRTYNYYPCEPEEGYYNLYDKRRNLVVLGNAYVGIFPPRVTLASDETSRWQLEKITRVDGAFSLKGVALESWRQGRRRSRKDPNVVGYFGAAIERVVSNSDNRHTEWTPLPHKVTDPAKTQPLSFWCRHLSRRRPDKLPDYYEVLIQVSGSSYWLDLQANVLAFSHVPTTRFLMLREDKKRIFSSI